MSRKPFRITADLFDNKYLTALMDFMAFVSPAKVKNESEIRQNDRKLIAEGKLGEPVESAPANVNGVLDRDRILMSTTLFGSTPRVTEKDIKYIADAGFDFIINENQGEYGKQILDWCEKYNVAAIDEECREFFNKDFRTLDFDDPHLFDGVVFHPASVGDCCTDEPHTSLYEVVSKYHNAYKNAFPDRFNFVNLLPGGAIKNALGAKSYTEYIDRFSKEVDTDYISVDIYPFHPSSIINIVEMSLCLHTYHAVGNACRRDKKDFWLYIQTQMRWFSHLYTTTTFEMIKWQVYASICYGCRSIIHASYNPVWGNDAIGIIDYDGNLTEQYLYVKRINSEIAKLSPIIKDYRSLGVSFAEAKKLNHHFVFASSKQKKDNKLQGFSGISEVKSVKSAGTALLGFFENQKHGKALMIVNCQNIYDPYASQTITVNFAKKYAVTVYEHGEMKKQENTDSLTLYPGSCDGIFITIDTIA